MALKVRFTAFTMYRARSGIANLSFRSWNRGALTGSNSQFLTGRGIPKWTQSWVYLLMCLFSVSLIAGNDEDIAKKYGLSIGKYLCSTEEKVYIKNWHHPSIRDYWRIQKYLTDAPRPELQYLNCPGTTFRADRMRNFRLISQERKPLFEIIPLNGDPSDKTNCIVTYVSIDDGYIIRQKELIQRLRDLGFNGHVIQRVGGWPATEMGTLKFFDIPYAFKICALLEAKSLGYQNCLWLDSYMVPLTDMRSLFDHITEQGIFLPYSPTSDWRNHIQSFATESFGRSLSDFLQGCGVSAMIVGINFSHERGVQLFDSWYNMLATQRLGFLSFIPEQAALCVLVDRLGLGPYVGNLKFIGLGCNPNQITSDVNVCWDRPTLTYGP